MSNERKIRVIVNYLGEKYDIFHIRYKNNETIALDPLLNTRGNDEKGLINLKKLHWTLHNKKGNKKTTFYSSTTGNKVNNQRSFSGKKKMKLNELIPVPPSFRPKNYNWDFENFKGNFLLINTSVQLKNKSNDMQNKFNKIEFRVNKNVENIVLKIFLSDGKNINSLKENKYHYTKETKIFKDFYPFLVIELLEFIKH